MVDALPASMCMNDEAAFSIDAIQSLRLNGDATDSGIHDMNKDLADSPNVSSHSFSSNPKEPSHAPRKTDENKSSNIFGRMVEQDTGPFIVKPKDLSVSEQTRFSKMIMGEGGILIKGHISAKDASPADPEFAKIYVPQNIEKEGATNNWDCYEAADKSSPPCDSPPPVEVTKTPGIFARMLFKKGSSGEDSPEKPCALTGGAQSILESPAYPDSQDNYLPDDTCTGDRPARRKSFISGAIDLLRGRKEPGLEEEDKQEMKEAVFL